MSGCYGLGAGSGLPNSLNSPDFCAAVFAGCSALGEAVMEGLLYPTPREDPVALEPLVSFVVEAETAQPVVHFSLLPEVLVFEVPDTDAVSRE